MVTRILVALLQGTVFVCAAHADPPSVVISEIMYHPLSDGADEFLELYNAGDTYVDLEGWRLEGAALVLPAGAFLAPGEFLVLAEDAARFNDTYGFIPDFVYPGGLDNGGERLALYDAMGTLVDSVTYDDMGDWPPTADGNGPSLEVIDVLEANESPRNWHSSIDSAGHSAGAVNSVAAVGLPPLIRDVRYTVEPTPYDPVQVTVQVEDAEEVSLTYRIDFEVELTVPMLDDGLNGDGAAGDGVYGASIPGQAAGRLIRLRINATRATGAMSYPRDDDTINYVGTVVADLDVDSALPLFNWFINPRDFQDALDHRLSDILEPAVFYYNGVLYDNIRVRIRGLTSRTWPKNHWKFRFPQGHEFFDRDLVANPVDQFNLQGSYSDKSYIREILAFETFRDAGCSYCITHPVRLHKNGVFFGLYVLEEAPDDDYLERNDIDADGAFYKAFDDVSFQPMDVLLGRYEKRTRVYEDYTDLYNLLDGINNLSGEEKRLFLFDNVDIPGMLNYIAANCIIHNNDHLAKNYFLYRDTAGIGRWVMHPWDMDLTFGRNFTIRTGVLNDAIWADYDGDSTFAPSHPLFGDRDHRKIDQRWNRLIDAVLQEPDIREMYFRRLRTLMDELLIDGRYEARIDELVSLIFEEAELDRMVWGQYGAAQSLDTAIDILKNEYLAARRIHLFETHRVPGEIPAAQSLNPSVVISEIMYNPAGNPDDEFLELYNPSSTESVDLSGWRVDGIGLTIPSGTVILPSSYVAFVRSGAQFRAAYGSARFIPAQYDGKLSNTGELITLYDRSGRTIDAVRYENIAPWPESANGMGASLELIDPTKDNARVANWSASGVPGGTPAAPNTSGGTIDSLAAVYVNEVLSANGSINADEWGDLDPWIELYNASGATIDLTGAYLTDDFNAPYKWELPSGTTIDGLDWLLIWADNEPEEGPYHTSFTPGLTGGSIGLFNADGVLISYLNYEALPKNISYGRRPDGGVDTSRFSVPVPGGVSEVVSPSLILNEYNAVDSDQYLDNGGSDTLWGTVLGNGGDWFELVVVEDHLDVRGWQLVVRDDTGDPTGEAVETLVLSPEDIWSDLRRGTIITVCENLATDLSYDPLNDDWWINVQARDDADGVYITNESFKVSNRNWQLTILDELGAVRFGPAGEGVNPLSGIGNDEVFKLEENPEPFITPFSNYKDGTSSTCGAPNVWGGGSWVQDFTELRSVVVETCSINTHCDDDNPCTDDVCSDGVCINTANNAPCDDGDACTYADACRNGVCTGGVSKVCNTSGDPCRENVCDSATGRCVPRPVNEGESCDDGTPCNGTDTCDAFGTCVHTPANDCNDNDVEDWCDVDAGTSDDCNANAVPDDCDPDGDGDGIPDECDRKGDFDHDADADLFDFKAFGVCLESSGPDSPASSWECVDVFDSDGDDDVDLRDFSLINGAFGK